MDMKTGCSNEKDDVVLEVNGEKFLCERKLLSSSSAYFSAMFGDNFIEKNKKVINIQGVDPAAMKFLLEAVSTKSVDFTKCESVLDMLEASCMLQFDTIRDTCIKFIISSWLDQETWLPTSAVADKLGLTKLQHKAKMLALWNFSEVRKTQSFLSLAHDELLVYLNNDKLRVKESEFEVFEAVVTWIENCPEERLFHSIPLLSTVRFRDISTFDIKSMFHYSVVQDTPQAELILECVLDIRSGTLNQSCEACNTVVDDTDVMESSRDRHSSVSSSSSCQNSPVSSNRSRHNSFSSACNFVVRSTKRKRRTTSHCTCFDPTTIASAENLLVKGPRTLPLVPCVVANIPVKSSDIVHSPRQKWKEKSKQPYIFFWDGKKPVPFLHLEKIDQGPAEPVGYKVIIKDLKMYVIGGEYMMGYGDWNTSVWVYDTWTETWTFETSLPSPRRHHSACSIGNDVYIIGGVGRHRVMLDTVAKYNLVTKSWTACALLPTPLYSPACCVFKEDIFLFGPQVLCYRQSVDVWSIMNDITLPENIAVATAMAYKNKIYLIGAGVPKVYCFEPHTEITTIEYLGKFKTSCMNACIIDDIIFTFGEEDGIRTVEEYKILSKEFAVLWEEEEEGIIMGRHLNQGTGCFALPKY